MLTDSAGSRASRDGLSSLPPCQQELVMKNSFSLMICQMVNKLANGLGRHSACGRDSGGGRLIDVIISSDFRTRRNPSKLGGLLVAKSDFYQKCKLDSCVAGYLGKSQRGQFLRRRCPPIQCKGRQVWC